MMTTDHYIFVQTHTTYTTTSKSWCTLEPWVISSHGCTGCNIGATCWGCRKGGKALWGAVAVYGAFLYLLLKFIVNLKLFYRNKVLKVNFRNWASLSWNWLIWVKRGYSTTISMIEMCRTVVRAMLILYDGFSRKSAAPEAYGSLVLHKWGCWQYLEVTISSSHCCLQVLSWESVYYFVFIEIYRHLTMPDRIIESKTFPKQILWKAKYYAAHLLLSAVTFPN